VEIRRRRARLCIIAGSCATQEEGEALACKTGEVEAALRRTRPTMWNNIKHQLSRHEMSSIQQDEGQALARKNGEVEAALQRTRAACRESDAEANHLAGRAEALEAQVRVFRLRCCHVLCRLIIGKPEWSPTPRQAAPRR